MSCNNPSLMLKVPLDKNPDFLLRSKKFKLSNGFGWKFLGCADKFPDYDVQKFSGIYKDPELLTIPCGNCIACRLQYSREWANRCMLESTYYEHNYFITLTYDYHHK